MTRVALRIAVAGALIGFGWAVGKAQSSEPDFELVVTAPVGETSVQCTRGCELVWWERGPNPRARPQPQFTFACSGAARCSSARIAGWITR